jgi:hypothetical protein
MHRLDITAIGRRPHGDNIAVRTGDTLRLTIPLATVTTLETVKVSATVLSARLREIEERRRMGVGQMRDSSEVARYPGVISSLRSFTGVRVEEVSRMNFRVTVSGCSSVAPRIDGAPVTLEDIALLDPRDVALVELYRRVIPVELESRRGCPLMVWTKRYIPPHA